MPHSIAAVTILVWLMPMAVHASERPASAAETVNSLAGSYVAEFTQRFPEQAAFNGITLQRHDSLTDNSQSTLRQWEALEDRWAAQLETFDSRQLFGKPEWVVLGFLREAIQASRQRRVCRYDLWPVSHLLGWQSTTAELAGMQPVGTDAARREALARWSKLPGYLTTEIDNLRQGLRNGYSTPRANVRLVIRQLDEMLASPIEQWPLYSPALRDESAEFKKTWRDLLVTAIKPAVQRYNEFLKNEYVDQAREINAITAHPHGTQCYQASFRSYTTIDRPGAETFELGRREVERNQAAALAVGKHQLKANDLPTLLDRLNKDPANHFSTREELLKFAQAAVVRAHDQMPKWFSRVPKADIVVEPYPDFLERGAADSYWPAAEDGSRPAMYRITLAQFAATTRSNAEITALHEAYPGHHLQIGLASERPDSHPITRLVGNSGFNEGWARYAEALAEEMGLYSSPYALANRRLWPARGMVVDPGIHLFGWTREQAVEFVVASGRFDREVADSLVDRVALWPGQLTAYDTGALEFFALRDLARQALGERFDIREFHAILLENGSVTLPMLREQVTHWIERKLK